ncbi:MAG: hypothetical protein ABH969_00080, partial [Pseudomonadota bacterium]
EDPSKCWRYRTWNDMERVAKTGGVVCTWPIKRLARKTFLDWATGDGLPIEKCRIAAFEARHIRSPIIQSAIVNCTYNIQLNSKRWKR